LVRVHESEGLCVVKTLTTSFYTVTLSVAIGLAVAMMFDVYIGTVVSFAVGAMTELTFSEMEENKKGLTRSNE